MRSAGLRPPRGAGGGQGLILGPALIAVLTALDRDEKQQIPWTHDTVHALIYAADAAEAVVHSRQRRWAAPSRPSGCTRPRSRCSVAPPIDWRDERARYKPARRTSRSTTQSSAPTTR